MLEFDDMELMQLQFCMQQTQKQMSMGGEIRRHASISKKIEEEMQRRKETNGSYTPENVKKQLEEELRELLKRRDSWITYTQGAEMPLCAPIIPL